MFERDIYTIHSTYREDMRIKGFQFGKGEKSACIVGAARGNEIQQMYICSQLVKRISIGVFREMITGSRRTV